LTCVKAAEGDGEPRAPSDHDIAADRADNDGSGHW